MARRLTEIYFVRFSIKVKYYQEDLETIIEEKDGSGIFEIKETESIICSIRQSITNELRMKECYSKRIPYITEITIKNITPL